MSAPRARFEAWGSMDKKKWGDRERNMGNFQMHMNWWYIGVSPLPGFESPPGLWTIFSRESQPKPSFPLLLGGGTTQVLHI